MIQLDTLTLPDDLIWTDEFSAQPVAQTTQRTLDGGLVVFYGGLTSGLPISLESPSDGGWTRRDLVQALALRAASPGGVYTLSLRGQAWQVMFRHQEPPAFEAQALLDFSDPGPDSFYRVNLKLMTI